MSSQFEYDGGPGGPVEEIGNLTKITDESGSTVFAHDLKGRVLTRTQFVTAGGANVQLSMQYNYGSAGPEIGKLTSMTYPSGARVNYVYGDHGRVSSVTLNQSATSAEVPLLTEITYTPTGEVQSWKWGSGMLPTYQRTYDLDGRLTSYPIDLQGTIRTVGYNAAGMITSYTHSGGLNPTQFDQTFTYDTADRLAGFTSGGIITSYSYDANGNRTQQTGPNVTYSYDAASNRLSSASFTTSQVYGYDAAGNRTSDSRNIYTYSDRGRLSHVSGGAMLDFYYNALDQRVLKAGVAGRTHYVYDENGRTIGSYSQGVGVTAETVYLDNLPIAVVKPNGYLYVLADHIITPIVLAQSNGLIVWDWRNRDPFGNNTPATSSEINVYDHRFPGQIADRETGILYNYFRDYDPQTGRYIQSDPIGLEGGINTYGYVSSNPLSKIDPFGLVEIFRSRGVTFDSYPKGDGRNESARRGPHGEYHFHINGDKNKVVDAYTLNPENPDALTKAEKAALSGLSNREKQYIKKACREVFHNNHSSLPKLRIRYLSAIGAVFGPLMSNSVEEVCSKDYNNDLQDVCE